jgi:SNF2 family DNA or RNA helicase
MPHLQLINNKIIVSCGWNEKELVKSIPGSKWDGSAKQWTLPLKWSSIVTTRGIFPEVTFDDELTTYIWNEHNARVEPSLDLRNRLSYESVTNTPLDERLYDFQVAGAHWLNIAGNALLADEMGTGKTIQTIAALELKGDEALPALVICPNSVKMPWFKAIKNWHSKARPYVVTGSAGQRKKIIEEAQHDPNAIVIINIESVRLFSRLTSFGSVRLNRCRECDKVNGQESISSSKCEVHQKLFNTFGFKTVILDEAHRIKDPTSKQTRACWAVGRGDSVTWRIALTGTPLANHPGDLWSIMHFIEPEEFSNKSKFVSRYCLQSWNSFGGLDIVGVNPSTKTELFKILDPRMRRITKDLVLKDLPPKIRSVHYVEMTPKQRKAYNELDDNLITRLHDGSLVVAPNNLVAATRHIQLASAYMNVIKPDETDPTTWVYRMCDPSPKLDALEEIIADLELSKSFVVAAESRQLIELASARLEKAKIRHMLITGNVNQYERESALELFQSGKIRALLFTIKAGGTGLTMTAADTMIFLQRSWSMVDNLQAEDRVHRIGSEQHSAINYIDIVCQDTIEVDQIERLHDKAKRLEEIVRDRERRMMLGLDVSDLAVEEDKIMNSFLGSN